MWGQRLIVDSRAGALGSIGAAFVAQSAPDGYTLLHCNIAPNAISLSLIANIPYSHKDFSPITLIGMPPNVVTVHPSTPIKSITQLVEFAKTNPNKLSYSSETVGTSPLLPDVSTMQESGVPGFEVNSWYGVCVLSGTPAALLDKLNADLYAVLRVPAVEQRLSELAMPPAPTTREEFDKLMRAEIERWAGVIRDAKIPKQ